MSPDATADLARVGAAAAVTAAAGAHVGGARGATAAGAPNIAADFKAVGASAGVAATPVPGFGVVSTAWTAGTVPRLRSMARGALQ